MKPKIHEVLTRTVRPIKIVQFGEGNFLRGFVDDFIQQLNDKQVYEGHVCVIQPRLGGHVDKLMQQQGFYTLILEDCNQGQTQQITKPIQVIQQGLNPYTQWDDFLSLAENPDVQVLISNTTEAGIVYQKEKIESTQASNNFPAKVYVFLKHRWQHFQGALDKGCWILPCELIEQNGSALKEILLQIAQDQQDDADFITWINQANHFYNTLVDRIVVGYPHQQASFITDQLGYEDSFLVQAEVYHSWLIQGDKSLETVFPLSKLGANIQYVEDLSSYRKRKVAILNGCHTCMVPLGWYLDFKTVQETCSDPSARDFLEQFLRQEVWPSLPFSTSQLEQYTSEIMKRFENPSIRHELQSISLNSFNKFKTRILPSLVHHYQTKHTLAKHSLFILASLILMGSLKTDDNQPCIKDDSLILSLYSQWNQNIDQTIISLLTLPMWEDYFAANPDCIDQVISYVHKIENLGFKQVLMQEVYP